jgi:putative tricarboxylic transport membrane protein
VGRDRWSAAGLALLALAYLLAARGYPLDTLATPGPGIVPAIAGVALLGVAIWLFAVSGRVGATRPVGARPASPVIVAGFASPAQSAGGLPQTGVAPTCPSESARLRSPLILAVALVLYVAVLPRLGFIVSSVALVVLAARLMGAPGWWRPVALALGVAALGYWLFARWLGVPLP